MKKIISYLLAAIGVGIILLVFLQRPAPIVQEQQLAKKDTEPDFSQITATPDEPPPYTGDSIISADLINGKRHSAKFLRLESSGELVKALIYSDDKLIQEIRIGDTTDYEEYYFADCNFDGYRDLLIRDEETHGGPCYWVLDYIPKKNKYELNSDLSEEPGLHIDSAHKQIIIHNKYGFYFETDDTFNYQNKELTFLQGTTVVKKDDDSLTKLWTYTTRRKATSKGIITTVDTVIEIYD